MDLDILKRFQPKPRNRVGLDIGSHSIKIVELSAVSAKPGLISFGLKKIPSSSKDAIVESLKALAEESRISVKELNISVSGPSVIVRLISMPKMTDEELKSAVRFETEKFIPFDINDCILDFQVLGKEAKDKNTMDIILAAVKKDYAWQKIKLVEEAGFAVKTVDVDSFAITNSFLRNFSSIDPAKTFAVLNIGAVGTSLSILRGIMPSFVREVAIGSNELDAAISKKLNVSVEVAEGLKMAPKDKMSDVLACIKPVLSNLLDEIKLSFGYHENQSGRSIDEIYISGGGAGVVGLDDAFAEAFGMKPMRWNPFQFLDTNIPGIDTDALERDKNSFSVAVGLALR